MVGRVADIQIKPYEPPPGVSDLAELFSSVRQRPYAMLLLSGGDLDCAGYSLMGWDPFLVLRAQGRRVTVQQGTDTQALDANPFDVLAEFWGHWSCRGTPRWRPCPLALWGFWPTI